ncbi:MAG: Gldg family protein [Candidatus Moraniibacteriota bacterium]|nr:MAG: Gldg family protein [Candidatus Moranbacteria bacterium]
MKNILTLIRKELQAFFNNPTAYIVIAAFLLLWEFLFFRQVFLIGEISVRGLFDFLPWLLLLVIPALTMGSLAEEKSEGTLEFLLTRPVRPIELILGKFFGILAFFSIATAFVFPIAWSFHFFGAVDWGQTIAQYLGGVFLAAILASLGIAISSLARSQITAFVVSAIASFFLIISGMEIVTSRIPLSMASFFEQFSVFNHFVSLARGVIDTRDIWYFISFTSVFLSVAFLTILQSKLGKRRKSYQQYRLALAVLFGIAFFSNIVGARIPGRIDLTRNQIYTLSSSADAILASLPNDIVNISLYASGQLPSEFQPVLRDTKDMLSDYQRIAAGKIQLTTKDPLSDESIASEAQSLGVQPVRFNVVSQEAYQVKEGYLGIVISFGGKHETIPFVQSTDTLEYQLSSLLTKLTTDKKPSVGILSGHGEKSLFRDYSRIADEWGKQFDVHEIAAESDASTDSNNSKTNPAQKSPEDAPAKHFTLSDDLKVLIVAGPTENFSDDEKKTISDFLKRGGSALFLVDGVTASPSTMSASKNASNFSDFIRDELGVTVRKDMVYDLRANESVSFGGGKNMQYILPYPLWIRAQKSESNSPLTASINEISLPWTSSIETDSDTVQKQGYAQTALFVTTPFAGQEETDLNIAPDQDFPKTDLATHTVAIELTRDHEETSNFASHIIIVGNSGFLTDQFVGNNPSNLSFGIGALAFLGQESSLGSIAAKNVSAEKFHFTNASEPTILKFGNIAFALSLTLGYGMFRLIRRNRKRRFSYEEDI